MVVSETPDQSYFFAVPGVLLPQDRLEFRETAFDQTFCFLSNSANDECSDMFAQNISHNTLYSLIIYGLINKIYS